MGSCAYMKRYWYSLETHKSTPLHTHTHTHTLHSHACTTHNTHYTYLLVCMYTHTHRHLRCSHSSTALLHCSGQQWGKGASELLEGLPACTLPRSLAVATGMLTIEDCNIDHLLMQPRSNKITPCFVNHFCYCDISLVQTKLHKSYPKLQRPKLLKT